MRETYVKGVDFQGSHLLEIYKMLLQEKGIVDYSPHITRFTNELLASAPDLEKRRAPGQKVKLFFKKDVDVLLDDLTDPNYFENQVNKFVSSIRKAMSKQNNEFTGQFLKGCQEKSVPKELLTLISMLVDGTNPNSKLSQFSFTCAQLIMSNYKPNNKTNEKKMTYHSRKRETPIVVYNALNLYGRFRSKGIITDMFHLGFCAPYLTVLGITKNIAEKMIKEFEKLGCFVLRSASRGIFTVIAKDNIDLNSRSYTATSHYHGTSVSLIQFSGEVKGTEYELSFPMDEKIMSFKISPLPEKYAKVNTYISDIPEYYAPKNNGPIPTLDLSILEIAVQHEFSWLHSTSLAEKHGWASHHFLQNRFPLCEKDFTAVLPLLREKVHTLSMQYHCMSIITDTIGEINPGQTPVDVCDQPIFALTKQIQWRHPDKSKNYFFLFGGLHIEKSLLLMHSDFIEGSGLPQLLGIRNLSICNLQTTVLSVTDITGARYALQVSACAIYNQLSSAHLSSESSLSIFDWLIEKSKKSVMALYWRQILELQIYILIYIRSIRESNFELHTAVLHALMKWYFSLDHIHYSRWLTVHLFDLVNLQQNHPDVYQNFCKGYFSFKKTCAEFSAKSMSRIMK